MTADFGLKRTLTDRFITEVVEQMQEHEIVQLIDLLKDRISKVTWDRNFKEDFDIPY